MTPNVKKFGAVLALALAVAGCSGEAPEREAAGETGPSTTLAAPTTTAVATTASPSTGAPTTTGGITDAAPVSLAFSSIDDLGRLFEIDGSVAPFESPGSDVRGGLIDDATLVQATKLRARDGVIWVQVNNTNSDRSVIGWVTSDELRPTSRSVEWSTPDAFTQFRMASRILENDLLVVRQSPSDTAPSVVDLKETEVAMHGGNTILIESGELWLDVIDSRSYQQLGWVHADSFPVLSGIEAKAADGTDVDLRPDPDVDYGADISSGVISATGCNAVQVTFESRGTARGSAVVFGRSVPVGSPLDRSNTTFRWTASGGSTVYLDPGQTATFTLPTTSSQTWYFTTLGEDGQAAHEMIEGVAVLNASGRAKATDLQQFALSGGSCVPNQARAPAFDDYWYDLPADERAAAIAQYEQELAEFEATNGPFVEDTTVQGTSEEPAEDEAPSGAEESVDPDA